MADPQFDVFLCHNSEDKPAVIEIAQQLKQKGLKPWLDTWELRPGVDWQEVLEEKIRQIKCVAVFVGEAGLGPWQQREMRAYIRAFVSKGSPVIPIILPSASQVPNLPIFLEGFHWSDFWQENPDPLLQLIWGITGRKPRRPLSTKKGNRIAESISVQDVATAQTLPSKPIAPKPAPVVSNKSKPSTQPPQQSTQSSSTYLRSDSRDSRRSDPKYKRRKVIG